MSSASIAVKALAWPSCLVPPLTLKSVFPHLSTKGRKEWEKQLLPSQVCGGVKEVVISTVHAHSKCLINVHVYGCYDPICSMFS